MLRIFLVFCFLFSFTITPSFSLTESINLSGEFNSADIVLNDIWIEPQNPKKGEMVSIYGSVYNAGIVSTEEVSDAVTIAYIVNGEIVEINLLVNVLPGIKNGTVISSGPIFSATPGTYTITTIINYHDTLSHLRDNPENNIIQKRVQVGDRLPSVVDFSTYQHYNHQTEKQEIVIQGEVTNVILDKLENHEIVIDIEGLMKEKVTSDANGQFSFKTEIPFKDKPVKITTYTDKSSFVTSQTQKIFPIKMSKNESALALEINSQVSENNLENLPLTIVLFQDNYDKVFEKVSTKDYKDKNLGIENIFLMSLPSDHKYIVEIYLEGRILDAFQNYFPSNAVIKKEVSILESSQIQFRIINDLGEPQNNVIVNTWTYSGKSNENGNTEWIEILPTFTSKEPYVAQAFFPDGTIVWSEPFLVESEEKKVITIVKGDYDP